MITEEIVAFIVLFCVASIVLSLPITLIVKLNKRDKQEKIECRKKARLAQEKIMEDGKIEGPKGKYVPHKKWDVGTPHETTGSRGNKSYNGDFWP